MTTKPATVTIDEFLNVRFASRYVYLKGKNGLRPFDAKGDGAQNLVIDILAGSKRSTVVKYNQWGTYEVSKACFEGTNAECVAHVQQWVAKNVVELVEGEGTVKFDGCVMERVTFSLNLHSNPHEVIVRFDLNTVYNRPKVGEAFTAIKLTYPNNIVRVQKKGDKARVCIMDRKSRIKREETVALTETAIKASIDKMLQLNYLFVTAGEYVAPAPVVKIGGKVAIDIFTGKPLKEISKDQLAFIANQYKKMGY
jgi:hypothetical protein